MTVEVTFTGKELAGLGARIHAAIKGATPKASLRSAQIAAGELRRAVIATTDDGTGALARSFKATLVTEGGQVVGKAVSTLVYAGIQDQGGTITAKGQNLAIPIKGGGVPRGKWPRDYPKGTFYRAGKALFFVATKQAAFALKPSVTLPAKEYVERAKRAALPKIKDAIRAELMEALA